MQDVFKGLWYINIIPEKFAYKCIHFIYLFFFKSKINFIIIQTFFLICT